jgi:predicted cupin superfamily sugar epimerase
MTLAICSGQLQVALGFDFADFEMAGRDDLMWEFTLHEEIIWHLTKDI